MCALFIQSDSVFNEFIFNLTESKVSNQLHLLEYDLIFQYNFKIFLKGPKPSSNEIFSICHWNLNSISVHNYIKLSLLRAYLSSHRSDVLGLSETYLNSDTSHEDANLEIVGYTLIRADHPSNTKQGGTCLYYRNSLAFRLLNIYYFSIQYLEECINFEILFAGKVFNFISLYRSPSKSHDILKTFADNLELNLEMTADKNPYLIVILGDFNTKSSNWYKHNKTTYEGSKIEAITSQFGLNQLIQEPTHVLSNSSSCIDLVFTSQPNLVTESRVHFFFINNPFLTLAPKIV